MTLQAFFQANPKAAIAFSGGADSAFLLWAAAQYGCDVRAYYAHTAFQPAFELADAKQLARSLQVPLTVLEIDILSVPGAAAGGADRCYYCKQALFTQLWQAARADGFGLLLDGTNASDDAGDRPGMRALRELEVRSPLRECGLTKADIRQQSRQAGLFTWDKPAYACLATRAAQGMPLDAALLHRIEAAEDALRAQGYSDFRVRVGADGTARFQVTAAQMPRAQREWTALAAQLAPWFDKSELDGVPRPASV